MFFTTIILAVREIRRHMLRSFLTVLGIVIGVAAVVTMVTLGKGATEAVTEQISSLGANILQIRPGQGFGRGGGGGQSPDFDMADVEAIQEQVAGIRAVAPQAQASGLAVRNAANWQTSVNGTTSQFFTAQQWALAEGGSGRRPRSRPARRSASSARPSSRTCSAASARSANASGSGTSAAK